MQPSRYPIELVMSLSKRRNKLVRSSCSLLYLYVTARVREIYQEQLSTEHFFERPRYSRAVGRMDNLLMTGEEDRSVP